MKHFFAKDSNVAVLFIGSIASDEAFLTLAKPLCSPLHVATSQEEIEEKIVNHDIHLIFGTLTFQGISYMDVLEKIRMINPTVEMVLFLELCDGESLEKVRLLKRSQHFCMKTQEKYALDYLKTNVGNIASRKLLLKGMQYFKSLMDASIVSQSDTKGNITYINENFTLVTGYTKEDVIGKNHRIMKHPSNPPYIFKEMWDTITKGEIWRERVLNRNKDGSDFWADTIIIPFKDEETGEITQYIAIRRDITQMLMERRASQEKEQKAHEQMKLSEAKDSFLVLFTHELKTPLNAIINFSQYLHKNMHRIEEIPKSKKTHLLEQIYKSASSMLENVTSILDLSKLRNHKINYTYSLFSVKESIEDVIERHESLARGHQKNITFQDDGSEPFMSSDEYRFKQILANILSNAIKYGKHEIEIFLLCDKEKIEIIIEDDGKGIEDKEGVFELYAQSSGGITNMEKKGTGIGLNFVKLLCEDLKFTCKIEDSASLGGAKFVLAKELKNG